jgi:hypothetical protein
MGEDKPMHRRGNGTPSNAGVYAAVLLLAILGIFVANQWHFTLMEIGRWSVQFRTVNRMGWNSATIEGLGRILWLMIGGTWLFAVMLLPGYLRDAARAYRLRNLVLRMLLVVAAMFGTSYLLLLLL